MGMDNLAKNAMLAREANMTYGKWKALQYQQQQKQETQPEPKRDIPEGWKRCEWCGKPFKPKTKRKQMYCEVSCQQQAQYYRNHDKELEIQRRYRERRKAAGDGKL